MFDAVFQADGDIINLNSQQRTQDLLSREGKGLTRPHPETSGQFMVAGEKRDILFIGVATEKVAVLL